MELSVGSLTPGPLADPQAGAEVVEHKGIGHPDTICDALAERLSVELSRHYLDRFGTILHHNVDKALLWGGAARPAFRGGELLAPMEIFLAGRAVCQVDDADVPVEELMVESARTWLRKNLRALDPARVSIVRCFDSDSSAVDPARIAPPPHIALIDGEHTVTAVLTDSAFCRKVLAPGGTILFDDFPIVYPAVLEITRALKKEGRRFVAARLDGKVFALFFDEAAMEGDPFLSRCRRRSRHTLIRYRLKFWGKNLLPGPIGRGARAARRAMRART